MSGNSFGTIFKVTTFGESHGVAMGAIIDGCPPNIEISEKDIQKELDKRKPGQSAYVTQRKESDAIEILSGVFEGKTTGTPIGLIVKNQDQRSKDYENIKDKFRPGHADFTYFKKYGIRDYRGGGRASARETVMRVAAGAIAKKTLGMFGIDVLGGVVQIGQICADSINLDDVYNNSFFFTDKGKISELEQFFKNLMEAQDSIGAKILIKVKGVGPGLGAPVFSKLDAELAKAVMSVNAVKAFEIGVGADVVTMRGSENNDEISVKGFKTNNSGGILGGISNGEDIDIFASIKPTSSISKNSRTVDIKNEEVDIAIKGRHDPCVGLRATPILESMVAITVLDQHLIDRAQCGDVKRD